MAVASLGFSFSAASIVKKTCLVLLNIILMGFGAACAVLSIYQIKLLPESFSDIADNLSRDISNEGVSRYKPSNLTQTNGILAYSMLGPADESLFTIVPTNSTIAADLTTEEDDEDPFLPEMVQTRAITTTTQSTRISSTVNVTRDPLVTSTSTNRPAVSSTSTTSVTFKPTAATTIYQFQTQSTVIFPSQVSSATISMTPRRRVRRSATTPSPVKSTSASHPPTVPAFFEEIYSLIVSSLYVCLSCGLVVLLSALTGLCGGLCRVAACLKCGVAGTVLVMLVELVSTAFIFVAHDKLVNKKNNSPDLQYMLDFLCSRMNFCINPLVMVLIGSFTSICLVFQVGSITMACKLIQDTQEGFDDNVESFYPGVIGEPRRRQRNANLAMQLMTSQPLHAHQLHNAYTTPFVPAGNYFPMMPMPQNMMMPPVMGYPSMQPQSRPVISIIS